MAITTAARVASAILHLSNRNGAEITNLRLQKYLYYAQAWYLVFNHAPLFDDNLEAWVHGPVVARVFGDYKHYRWSPITEKGTAIESAEINSLLEEVLKVYGKFTPVQLEQLTHQEAPWREARGGLAPDAPSRNIIKLETMKRFYSSLLHGTK